MNRTVYAVVRRDGIIVALLLSQRECSKVIRQGERVEVMHDVGWPTWPEWVDQLAAVKNLDADGAEPATPGAVPGSTPDALAEAPTPTKKPAARS